MEVVVGFALPLDGVQCVIGLLQNSFAIGGAIVKKDDADTAADLKFLALNYEGLAGSINDFFRDLSDL